jgi:hypothetical protein
VSSFEFISAEPTAEQESNVPVRSRATIDSAPVRSFAELTSTVYPPNPHYDISEKPWLPGPQKAYLLVNAKLVDPRAGVVHQNMTLQLAGGKIVRVSHTTAKELASEFYCAGQRVEKIDVGKYFICPGLIDCKLWALCLRYRIIDQA